uniref:Uncharacterized protein n=1 Tax=Cucumis melo TaxID=3656 RepID=A0A9I9EG76_CUCME
MKNVGANSDFHLVLFDEENRAVGFHSKSGGLWFFLNKLKRSCARDSGSGSVLRMIYEIFINYMTEILSLRLEITVCTLVEIDFPVSLGLLVKLVNFEVHFILASSSHESFKQSRQIQVQNNVVRRLHAIFRSKVAGSPGGGVTKLLFGYWYLNISFLICCSFSFSTIAFMVGFPLPMHSCCKLCC